MYVNSYSFLLTDLGLLGIASSSLFIQPIALWPTDLHASH
jgi:hypothetical protein